MAAAALSLTDVPNMIEWLARLPSQQRDIAVFQNVYDENVASSIDPDFLPVDGRRNARTETREIGLFLRMFHCGLCEAAPLTGIVSPKFNEKTKIPGREFIEFIRCNPGHNVYFINPFPQNAYYTYNVWCHGELCHPGLATLAETLFGEAGYDTTVIYESRDARPTLLYSSYWVGDRTFWRGYMRLVTRLIAALERLPPNLLRRFWTRDPTYPDPVPNLPFIFERTFSTYLHLDPSIRALAYPFMRADLRRYCDDVEWELVSAFGDLVDDIDRRKEYTRADRDVLFGLARLRAAATRRKWR